MPRDFNEILLALQGVLRNPDAYIEITFSVLVLRVYPGRTFPRRWRSDEQLKDRLKDLTTFMLSLADELEGRTRFFFEDHAGRLFLGIQRPDGSEITMPCEILAINRAQRGAPATAGFSFLDDDGESVTFEASSLRRIRL